MELYDVVEINRETNLVQVIATGKIAKNADAIVAMAVMRCGVDEAFYSECAAGKYKDGDAWEARKY